MVLTASLDESHFCEPICLKTWHTLSFEIKPARVGLAHVKRLFVGTVNSASAE